MTDPLIFLDANVLAKPVTRTLLIYAAVHSGYQVAWSRYVEEEADGHLRSKQVSTRTVRQAAKLDTTPAGRDAWKYRGTKAKDRQVVADAVAAGAVFIVTEDVDDFGYDDLVSTGTAAVNPDLFLAERTTAQGYFEAITLMSLTMTEPARSPIELHVRLGRQHPRLVAAHHSTFEIETMAAINKPPAVIYRGNRCLRCLGIGKPVTLGICGDCHQPSA